VPAAQAPPVSSRSSQPDGPLLPPLSTPRRVSPSSESASLPAQPVVIKQEPEDTPPKSTNGIKSSVESMSSVATSQHTSSIAVDKETEIKELNEKVCFI
jgi:hypothetical protein